LFASQPAEASPDLISSRRWLVAHRAEADTMKITVRDILKHKPDVYAVRPDDTMLSALELMAEKNIGAVLVMKGNDLAGIFSERDYARRGILRGLTSRETAVGTIMTTNVVSVLPSVTVEDCMSLMTEHRIRHLPVMEGNRVVGVVSIGDVVHAVVDEQRFTIRSLEHYVTS
jgi:CBS domain-containing protein